MWMVSEEGPVNGDRHVPVVHLLEEGGDSRGAHECSPIRIDKNMISVNRSNINPIRFDIHFEPTWGEKG